MCKFRNHFDTNQLHNQVHLLFPGENLREGACPDESCKICYPLIKPNIYFQQFWNWFQSRFFALSCTSKTEYYFTRLIDSTHLTQDHITRQLIFSIRYSNILSFDSVLTQVVRAINSFEYFTGTTPPTPLDFILSPVQLNFNLLSDL